MFEDNLSARQRRPLNRKRLGVVLALVLVALPLGYLGWRQWNRRQARATLGALNAALKNYFGRYEGYPDSLERLRGGEEGNAANASPERAQLLDTEWAKDGFEQNGYRFTYERGQRQQRWAATVPLYSSYHLKAEPLGWGAQREPFYYSDQTGEIRGRQGAPAGPDDPVVK